ncbi:MAG: 2,3-bisphosphoglycerate-independent phosphoglycerate mutase, partial [Planctomycetota bacterium]
MSYRPVMLMILDGFGHCSETTGNAVVMADTPNVDSLFESCPHTLITTSGRAVGLPEGVMGNSEVGHLNIGAGRVVRQEVMRITESIENGSFFENKVLVEAFSRLGKDNRVHLMGLVSDGKVHSSDNHYMALVDMAKKQGLEPDQLMFHVFLDGRDTPPTSGIGYVEQLHKHMQSVGVGRIATIGGRYWGMDRDKRWDRVQKHYRALTQGKGV